MLKPSIIICYVIICTNTNLEDVLGREKADNCYMRREVNTEIQGDAFDCCKRNRHASYHIHLRSRQTCTEQETSALAAAFINTTMTHPMRSRGRANRNKIAAEYTTYTLKNEYFYASDKRYVGTRRVVGR